MKKIGREMIVTSTLYSIAVYLVLVGAAIALYPGGIYTDPSTHGYSWTMNFFSDLGRTKLFDGRPNALSMPLFTVAMVQIGLVLVPFFAVLQSLFAGRRVARATAVFGSVLGACAGIAYVAVAVMPWDLFQQAHVAFNKAAFFLMMVMSVSYCIAMIAYGNYQRIAIGSMIFFAVVNLGYLWLLFFGPSIETPAGLRMQVVGQKMIVFVEVVILFLQAWVARGRLKAAAHA